MLLKTAQDVKKIGTCPRLSTLGLRALMSSQRREDVLLWFKDLHQTMSLLYQPHTSITAFALSSRLMRAALSVAIWSMMEKFVQTTSSSKLGGNILLSRKSIKLPSKVWNTY